MRRGPTNHFKTWTPDEIATLMRLVSEGVAFRTIAKELGRTPASVEYRAWVEKKAGRVPPTPDPHAS